MPQKPKTALRGEQYLSVYVSADLKDKLTRLARKYDRTRADIVRAVLKVGIPMMDGISEAEQTMVQEYVKLFRKLRQVKSLKEI